MSGDGDTLSVVRVRTAQKTSKILQTPDNPLQTPVR